MDCSWATSYTTLTGSDGFQTADRHNLAEREAFVPAQDEMKANRRRHWDMDRHFVDLDLIQSVPLLSATESPYPDSPELLGIQMCAVSNSFDEIHVGQGSVERLKG